MNGYIFLLKGNRNNVEVPLEYGKDILGLVRYEEISILCSSDALKKLLSRYKKKLLNAPKKNLLSVRP